MDTIQGKSFFKGEQQSTTQSIKDNKNTILHHICQRKVEEGIPPCQTTVTNTASPKSKSFSYIFSNCVPQ